MRRDTDPARSLHVAATQPECLRQTCQPADWTSTCIWCGRLASVSPRPATTLTEICDLTGELLEGGYHGSWPPPPRPPFPSQSLVVLLVRLGEGYLTRRGWRCGR